jgi:Tfp pilus assembly protein PilX
MSKNSIPKRRAGMVLLIVMGCLAIAMTLIVGWARIAVLENRQTRSAENHVQAEWLAEAAIQRAAAQLLADSEYPGETWRVTAADIGRRPGAASAADAEKAPEKTVDAAGGQAAADESVIGEIVIRAERVPDRAGARRVRVRADFPTTNLAGTSPVVATNRVSKQIVFDFSEPAPK